MPNPDPHPFGLWIQALIRRENLSRAAARSAFEAILLNQEPDLHQGAFLAALSAKGETLDELIGAWEAIDTLDTRHVTPAVREPLVENSGTGMDPFKTFNLSTAAAIVASARGAIVARHGARALTSTCGTVDLAELLGVDVEAPVDIVRHSIESIGLGLFNGMSAEVHPGALGRILSQIQFGSTLNTAASLAHPARPRRAVRGVYAAHRVEPVADLLQALGFERAWVVHGHTADGADAMDELSILGPTTLVVIEGQSRTRYRLQPEEIGLRRGRAEELQPDPDRRREAIRFVRLLGGQDPSSRREALLLNAAAILRVADRAADWPSALQQAQSALDDGTALRQLTNWVRAQSRDPQAGLDRLESLCQAAGIRLA